MPVEGPQSAPGFHLWHAALRWRQVIGTALVPVELTHTQFFVLGSLHWLSQDGPPMQKDVATWAGTDPMTTSQVVRALVKRGLIERQPDPDDGRAYRLVLTAKGRKTFDKALPLIRKAGDAFFKPLGKKGTVRLVADLQKLTPEPPHE